MDATAVRVLMCTLVAIGLIGIGGAAVVGSTVGDTEHPGHVSLANGPAGMGDVDGMKGYGMAEADGDDVVTLENHTPIEPKVDGFDEVVVTIELHENGTATWIEEYRFRLDESENTTADWEEIQKRIAESPDEFIAHFEERREQTLETARSTVDDRETAMTIDNFRLETDVTSTPLEYGYVRYSFDWSAFSYVEMNRIEAGDVLAEFVMDDRTTLVMTWPEGYESQTVVPPPDDRRETTVVWSGSETDFVDDDEPYLELLRMGGNESPETDGNETQRSPVWLLGLGIIALMVAGLIGWIRSQEDSADGSENASTSDAQSETQTLREDLLSNDERVLTLLERHGGRLKQQEVVSHLDWTEAKTSQVVRELRESGDIEVFRVGRENVLAIADGESEADDGTE